MKETNCKVKVTKIKGVAYVIFSGEMNQPVASVMVDGNGEIRAGWTDPDYRGRDYNKLLVQQILNDVSLKGENEFIIHCHPKNDAVNKIAKSLGFSLWHRWYKPKQKMGSMK